MKKLVDRKVRQTIHELGGTTPENLPRGREHQESRVPGEQAARPGPIFKGNPKSYLPEIQLRKPV